VTKPDNDQVVIDLRIIAYGRGADGIDDVKIDKSSGLFKELLAHFDRDSDDVFG